MGEVLPLHHPPLSARIRPLPKPPLDTISPRYEGNGPSEAQQGVPKSCRHPKRHGAKVRAPAWSPLHKVPIRAVALDASVPQRSI